MEQNSASLNLIRPDDLMEELGIKKDTYYADINYLGIKAQKDSEGKAYLTLEQAEQVRLLRSHVNKTGKREGFESKSIIKADNNNLAQSTEDIYVKPEEPTNQFNINQLVREAAELKAREIAMPHLVKRAMADRMNEDDLPPDLKEKVDLAREAANPKFTPAEVAEILLAQYRNALGG